MAVSYTHLDVYKRQLLAFAFIGAFIANPFTGVGGKQAFFYDCTVFPIISVSYTHLTLVFRL